MFSILHVLLLFCVVANNDVVQELSNSIFFSSVNISTLFFFAENTNLYPLSVSLFFLLESFKILSACSINSGTGIKDMIHVEQMFSSVEKGFVMFALVL